MDQPQPLQPASSPVPTPTFTPSEQNPIIIDHKHRPIVGGAFIIIVLTLSIFVGGLLFANYWPNTDEPVVVTTPTPSASAAGVPADWKTYTNEQYGFEFRYPAGPEYKIYDAQDQIQPPIVSLLGDVAQNGTGGSSIFSVSLSQYSSYEATVAAMSRQKDPLSRPVFLSEHESIIGEKQSREFRYLTDIGSTFSFTVIKSSPVLIMRHATSQEGRSRDYTATTLQILSTFKFIEQTSAVPADWKTYTNEQYSYSVRYPSSWFTDSTFSESDFTTRGGNDVIGGDTTWSNYPNPGQYNPSNNPADLKLISLRIYKTDQTIDQFIQAKYSTIQTQTPVIVGALPAVKFTSRSLENGSTDNINVLVKKGESLFLFENFKNEEGLFDQILSTFKFTE